MHALTRLALALLFLTTGPPCWANTTPASVEPTPAPAPATDPSLSPSESPSEACTGQHEAAQVSRMDGHLLEARAALLACAREACPNVVRSDCVAWLEEVQAQIPTVVFEALGDDGLLTDVEVKLGERVVQTKLDGKPVEMPAGLSELTFTRSSGERKSLRVLLRQGETNRIVSADFRSAVHAEVPSPAATAPPPETVATRPIPTSVWLAGTGALVALAAGTTLGIVAKVKESSAGARCAPDCSAGVVSEIEDFALAADVSFGVAIVAGVTTTILYLGRPTVMVPRAHASATVPSRALRLIPQWAVSTRGAWLGIDGRFP